MQHHLHIREFFLDFQQALGIEPKAASIRYVRALERLQKKLVQYTEFQTA